MNIETEIKFKIEDIPKLKKRLKIIGAKKIKSYFEHNLVLDTKDKKLKKSKALLRLRKIGNKAILGYKRKRSSLRYKKEEEIEVELSDFKKMRKIFKRLGFIKWFVYEKLREVYQYKNIKLYIDQLPFGNFLEIEGKEKDIKEVTDSLGLNIKQGITETYKKLYDQYCKKKKIKSEDIVFKIK